MMLKKTSARIFRVLLLLFVFSAFYLKANALTISTGFNSLSACCQHITGDTHPNRHSGIDNPVRKNATPNVILTVVAEQGRIAHLSWTISDYSISGTYYIERLDPSGWVVLKQLPYDTILVYNDTISFPYCTSTAISYQIRFKSELDDIYSSLQSAVLYDQTSPAEVSNLNVDITSTGFPTLSWTPVTGDDISKYRIQRLDNGIWARIDSVNYGTNSFMDHSVNACFKSYEYVVSTIDRCGIASDTHVYDEIAVHTIKLDVSAPGECDKFSNMVWNSYIHMPGGLGGYEISRDDGNSSISILNSQDTTLTTYVDNFNFKDNITYSYSVKAYSKNGLYTSSSCQTGWTYHGAILPDSVYITQVSVENNKDIRVVYHLHPAGSVQQLILERSEDGGTIFHPIDTLLSISGVVPQDYSFLDTDVNVHNQSYTYRLVAIDNCGSPVQSLNTSRSIWLQCKTSATANLLDWNTYETWLNGVKGYDIYRILNEDLATVVDIGKDVSPSTVSFSDLLTNYDNTRMACYWVQGTENPGNYLNMATSISNTCCILKEPVLFMPNAFRPEGTNIYFRPVPEFLYVDKQSFTMIIFSRWGQQLFKTTNMDLGWDGKINGQDAPAGLYSYIISYKSLEDKEYTKRGTVTLVR